MAGEWIKVRTNLWDDTRVCAICDKTGQSEATVIGGLYWLWSTADEHTEDGLCNGLSVSAIDRKTGIKGFGAALVSIKWLEETPDGVRMMRFDEHNGASAKARATTAKRVAKHRSHSEDDEDVTGHLDFGNGDTVTVPLAREDKSIDKKKRNSKKSTTDQPVGEKPNATGTRLPADWKPNQADIDYCKTQRPDLRPSLVATNFYDYWIAIPGAKGRKLDWSATWRGWVRKESAANAGRTTGPAGSVANIEAQRIAANAANTAKAKEMLFGKKPQPDNDETMVIENA